jgi:hypothetical protein
MGDRRRRSLGARGALGLLVVALATGCGVSTSPEPADEGDAAVAESISPGVTRTPPIADSTRSPRDLVVAFFQTAAGGGEDAVRRAKDFLVPAAQAKWQSGKQLLVVRITKIDNPVKEAGDKSKVKVRYQPIGIITVQGWVEPRDGEPESSFTFTVVQREPEPGQFRLQNAPNGLMISDETLEEYYRPTPIYFWDTTKTRLVPDLRYLALTTPAEQRPNQVVKWLLAGPSPWLSPAVVSLKEGTTQKGGGVAPRSSPLVVNLSSTAASTDDPGELQRIVDQLRWSLRPYVTGPVELQIEDQKKDVDGSSEVYLKANVAARPRPSELFGVKNGRVLAYPPGTTTQLPVLSSKANAGVESAAMSDDQSLAAFVHGRAGVFALTVVSINEDKRVERPATGLPSPLGRPAWIPGPGSPRFLIPAGGQLYAVSGTGDTEKITPNVGITSVSVAPDGRRVAFVAHEDAYVAALSIGGVGIDIGPWRRIVPERLTAAAIAWTSEDQVVVAGISKSGGNAALFQSTADGAIAKDVSPKDLAALTNVVAFPDRQNVLVLQTQSQNFFYFPGSGTPDFQQLPDSPFYAG